MITGFPFWANYPYKMTHSFLGILIIDFMIRDVRLKTYF